MTHQNDGRLKRGQVAEMQNGLHFISGLPRSGSTLLAGILRQNPKFHAGMSSPVGALFNQLLNAMGATHEHAIFIEEEQRQDVLRGLFDSYYRKIHPEKLVFDTNRLWCSRMAALASLFPESKVIACVRDPIWVIDSFERPLSARTHSWSLACFPVTPTPQSSLGLTI